MRKKFTMLLAALLACVGVAKADVTDLPQITTDLENPIYYTIYNTRSGSSSGDRNFENGGLIYYAGDDQGIKDGRAAAAATLEDVYKFYFTGSHEELYIHNAAANGKKLKSATSWTDEGQAWMIAAKTNGLVIGPKGGDLEAAGSTNAGFLNEANYGQGFNSAWHSNDAGSLFAVELVEKQVYPITGSFYFIECPLFFNKEGEHRGLYVDGTTVKWKTFDATDQSFYWVATVNDNGTVQLKNVKTGQWLNGNTTSETAVDATIKPLGDNQFGIKVNDYVVHADGHDSGSNDSGGLANWAQIANSPSAWCFVQKNDPTALQKVVVKYSFTYGGEEKYTQEVNTLVGEEWPAITVSFPYGVSSATKPAGEVTAEGAVEGVVTKTIELAVNLPFTYASDYASIENWYYINIHTAGYYLNYKEGAESMDLTATAVPVDQKDAYTWAFVGNPFDGYQIVNKAAGESMILSSSTTMVGNNGSGTYPIMTNTPVADGYNTLWFATASSDRTNGFYLEQSGVSANKMNRRDGKLAYWTTGKDAGSTFMVELRDDAAALQALVNSANELLTNLGEGTAVGCVTADSKADVVAAIASANTAIENNAGYVAAEIALQAAINALETIQPEEGKFYTIVSSCTKDHRAGQEVYVDKDGVMHFARVGEVASEIARVFQFVPANDGKFYLYNIEKDAYMQSIGTATEFDETKAKAVTIANMGKDNIVSIKPDGQNQMHAQDANSIIVGWNNNNYDDGSAWKIVETELSLNDLTHTLTVTEAGWATLVLGYNTEIPAGVKAYAVSSIAEGKAVLTEVVEVLPAHTPVLIEAAAGNYAFNYTADEATVESNLLAGSVFNTYVAPVEGTTNYVLSNNGGVVALYKKTTTNDAGKIVFAANKAYLPVETATEGAPAMFAFSRGGEDENTTGIDQLINANGEVVIYDLAGRRVEKMEKGIYIVNGKKVIR